jgi:hypothetical protein
MKDARIAMRTVIGFFEANAKIGEVCNFEFLFGGERCHARYLDGVQSFSVPEQDRPKLEKLLKAAVEFSDQMSSFGIDEQEANAFLGQYFQGIATTVKARRFVRSVMVGLDIVDVKDTLAFSEVLEGKMEEALAAIMVNVSVELVEAKKYERMNKL